MPRNPTVVFPAPNRCVIEDRDVPAPQAGQLLVRTTRSLVSTGTEMTLFTGDHPDTGHWVAYGSYPVLPGYSNIGRVEAVGAGVEPSWVGRRVASFKAHAAYATPAPDGDWCFPVPDGPTDEQAAFFAIGVIVMNGVRMSRVAWGESVAIFGAGLLGQFAARICLLAGARPVFVLDPAKGRLALLPRAEALVPVDPTGVDLGAFIKERTQGRLCDAVFEVTGNGTLIPGEFAALKRPLGRFVLLSSPRQPTTFDFHDLSNVISSEIIGAHLMAHPPTAIPQAPWTRGRNAATFFDWITAGVLDPAPLISHRFAGTDAPKAYDLLLRDRGSAMGVILEWPA